jgi:hypothetical protein
MEKKCVAAARLLPDKHAGPGQQTARSKHHTLDTLLLAGAG